VYLLPASNNPPTVLNSIISFFYQPQSHSPPVEALQISSDDSEVSLLESTTPMSTKSKELKETKDPKVSKVLIQKPMFSPAKGSQIEDNTELQGEKTRFKHSFV